MALLKSLFFAFIVGAVADHDAIKTSRITGGNTTTIDQYPSVVQVDFRTGILWTQNCAANILNERYLISAAHCFLYLFGFNNRRIRAGTNNRNTGGVIYSVSNAINHPSYGLRGHDGDITLVRLSSNIQFNDFIQPGTIVVPGYDLPDDSPVVHVGWGAVWQGGPSSALLREVTINSINHDVCRERYASLNRPQVVTDNMICAGVLDEGGRDACNGDSGGPLYYGDIIVGIVSWGDECGDAHLPGVSTAVSRYTQWILDSAV